MDFFFLNNLQKYYNWLNNPTKKIFGEITLFFCKVSVEVEFYFKSGELFTVFKKTANDSPSS